MTTDVFVVGALHLDVIVRAPRLPQPDETLPGSAVDYAFGGKGGNQARAAARHGARTAMAGRVGDDRFADTLLDHLAEAGVAATQVRRGPGASGMSVAIVEDSGDYGAVIVSGVNAQIDPTHVAVPPGTRFLLLQNEIPEAVNAAVAGAARTAGAQVILNAAPAREVSPELLQYVDLLIVNRGEAATLTGRRITTRAEAETAARALAGDGRAAIVTLGAEGLVHCDGTSATHHPAHPAKVISTHGAGDCFVGALAAQLAAGRPMDEALAYAQAAAALHVSTPPEDRAAITPEAVRAAQSSR